MFRSVSPVRHVAAAVALLAAFAPGACARGARSGAGGTPPPAPAPPAAIRQTCPDPSDGPSVVIGAIEAAHRALVESPATPLPPVCVVTALARITVPVADSSREHALGIANAIARRESTNPELLGSTVELLAALRRPAEVSDAYDRLVAVDAEPPMTTVRLALAAAHARRDTAALLRVLSSASARADAPPAVRAEYDALRNSARLWTAINTGKGYLRSSTTAYASIVSNFGTLGLADSVAVYARRATGAGVARTALAPAVELFVSTVQRHASLYAAFWDWEAALRGVARVDSALSTPSTKFTMAALIVQFVGPAVASAGAEVVAADEGRRAEGRRAEGRRAEGCRDLSRAMSRLDEADAHLEAGGGRHSAASVASLRSALSAARQRAMGWREMCSGVGRPQRSD